MNTRMWKSALTIKEMASTVKAAIKSKELTQEGFARQLLMSESVVSHALNGVRLKALDRIADHFGYERGYIRKQK